MKSIFADTVYWRALIDARDQHRPEALRAAARIQEFSLVTTQEVLIEFVNALSDHGPHLRRSAVRAVQEILADRRVLVISQSAASFAAGWVLYQARMDKGYSLTDCISMEAMRSRDIADILTHDEHFAREGFRLLL